MKDDNYYFELAAKQARKAQCERARCGSVIVAKDGAVIGRGYNAPPLEDETQKHCTINFKLDVKPKYDKTCCVHAEWNAILDAMRKFSDKMEGATLYFMRVDEDGKWTEAGDPFCTVCSRLAMQSGLAYFGLWNESGIKLWPVREYNTASFDYYL